jgi:hypothetical protein
LLGPVFTLPPDLNLLDLLQRALRRFVRKYIHKAADR